MTESREWTYPGRHGRLVARTWSGTGAPSHVVVIAHGYGEQDLADGGSPRLLDRLIPSGDAAAVLGVVGEHLAAGADRVAVQVVAADLPTARTAWRELAAAA